MNVKKQAQEDAKEYVVAQAYYGPGANIRRRHIETVVAHRVRTQKGYAEAFDAAYLAEDWSDAVKQADKERKRVDRGKKVERNVRGLVTGNKRSMTTSVATIAGVVYIARELGLDHEVKLFVKPKYERAKAWTKAKHRQWKAQRVVKPVKMP